MIGRDEITVVPRLHGIAGASAVGVRLGSKVGKGARRAADGLLGYQRGTEGSARIILGDVGS